MQADTPGYSSRSSSDPKDPDAEDARFWKWLHGISSEMISEMETRRRTLLAEVAILDENIPRLRAHRRDIATYMRTGKHPTERKFARSAQRRLISGMELRELAERTLREAGHPMTRRQIIERIEASQGPIQSRDGVGHLGNVMWAAKDVFVAKGRSGYGLVAWDRDSASDVADHPA